MRALSTQKRGFSWYKLCRHSCQQWRKSWHNNHSWGLVSGSVWLMLFAKNSKVFITSRVSDGMLCCFFDDDDVIKGKYFPSYWPFVRGIHRSPVSYTHKGQWRGALMFSSICVRINGWVNSGEAVDLRRHRVLCDVVVMCGYDTLVDDINAMRPRQNSPIFSDDTFKCIFLEWKV